MDLSIFKRILLFSIIFSTFLFLFLFRSPKLALAESQTQIGFGQVELRVPSGYDRGIITKWEYSGPGIDSPIEYHGSALSDCNQVSWGGTYGNPCVLKQDFPNPRSDVGITLQANQNYTVKITQIAHLLSNNTTDNTGSINCIKNCGNRDGDSWVWTLKPGNETGKIVFEWKPDQISRPQISVSDNPITRNKSSTITVVGLDKRAIYYVDITHLLRNNQRDFSKTTKITVNGQDCRTGPNELNVICIPASNPSAFVPFDGQFTVQGSMFPETKADQTYTISVDVRQKDKTDFPVFKEPITASLTVSAEVAPSDLQVNLISDTGEKVNTLEILPKAEKTIVVDVSGTIPNKKYTIKVVNNGPDLYIKDQPATSTNAQFSFSTKDKNQFLYTAEGAYPIAVKETDSDRIGQAYVKVNKTPGQQYSCSLNPTPPKVNQNLSILVPGVPKDSDFRADLVQNGETQHAGSGNSSTSGFVNLLLMNNIPKGTYSAYVYDSEDNQVCRIENFNVDVSGAPGAGAGVDCIKEPGKCSKSAGTSCSAKSGNETKEQKQDNKTTYIDTKTGAVVDPNDRGVLTAIGCIPTTPQVLIQGILGVTAGIGGGIALLLMVLGAFRMITSAGNPETIKGGREQFVNAVIGLLFVLFSVTILKIIGIDILNLK